MSQQYKSRTMQTIGRAVSIAVCALLIAAPLDELQANRGKGSDQKKHDDKKNEETQNKKPSTEGNSKKETKETKTRVPKKDSGPSKNGTVGGKKPKADAPKQASKRDQPDRKKTQVHNERDKRQPHKQEVKRLHRFVSLPLSPFKLRPFTIEQPSFSVPQRAVRSTVPPPADLRRARTREVVIALPDTTSDEDAVTLSSGLILEVAAQKRLPLLGMKIVRLRIPEGRDLTQALSAVIDQSVADTRILEVQPNFVFETAQAAIGSMASVLPQYATEKVRLGEAHRFSLGRNVRVAVIDTGLDASHPELAGVAIESFDAIGEGRPTTEAHGTAVAGIVAARQQIRGMAPDARVLAVRAFSSGTNQKAEATTLSIINGIHWAIANGARVINMSFAGPKDALLQRAIEAGIAKGVIFVAAAGNGGPSAAQAYPAAYEGVIAVTAIDSNDQLYRMANRGGYIALAAPGVDILAPAPNAAYEMSSGTSLAAAHVSGIIALMLERRPTLSTEEARAILMRTARDPGQTAMANGLGAGIIDAARAVAEIQ